MNSNVQLILDKHDNERLSNRLQVPAGEVRDEVTRLVESLDEVDRFWYLAGILIGDYKRRHGYRVPGKARITPVALASAYRNELFEDLTECGLEELDSPEPHRYVYYLG